MTIKADKEVFAEKAPEIIVDLASHTAKTASELFGMETETAESLGIAVALKISEAWSGAQVYIPTNIAIKVSLRDMAMFDEFNGVNHAYLSKKYKCSVVWVYQVVKRVGEERRKKQQPQLPFKQKNGVNNDRNN